MSKIEYYTSMKRVCMLLSMVMLIACNAQQGLKKNAEELFYHIPETEALEKCKGYLTDDFYSLIEEMISLPDRTPVLHEWEFWFVAVDGSAMADNTCEVKSVERTDKTHARAIILVHPSDKDYDVEEHTLLMEKVGGRWLLTDYDDMKSSCLRYIGNYRKEEVLSE